MSQFIGDFDVRGLTPAEIKARGQKKALWEYRQPFAYYSTRFDYLFQIPKGFITDFASVPAAAAWYISPDDPGILFPSGPHDLGYSLQGIMPDGRVFTREQIDQVIREGMILQGARTDQVLTVYGILRAFGGFNW